VEVTRQVQMHQATVTNLKSVNKYCIMVK